MKSFRKTKIFTVYNTNLTDMSLYNLTDIWSVICVAGDVLVTFSDCSQPQLLTNIKVLITNDIKRFHSFLQYTCERTGLVLPTRFNGTGLLSCFSEQPARSLLYWWSTPFSMRLVKRSLPVCGQKSLGHMGVLPPNLATGKTSWLFQTGQGLGIMIVMFLVGNDLWDT